MNSYQFNLVLSGLTEITSELADALFSAIDGEIEFNMRDDVAFIEVNREADTLQEAVNKTISEVECAGLGLRVMRVESEAASTIAKINEQLLGVGGS